MVRSKIAALTVLGMLLLPTPTMTWTYLRVPRMKRPVEFLCLLPLAIPAIVLVVGIAPIYSFLTRTTTRHRRWPSSSSTSSWCCPFAHRAIDAGLRSIDVETLAEAARSLGAGWPRVMLQVIVPNIRGAILSAAVITVALVLGEFTISSLLNYDTLQVVINLLGKRERVRVGRGVARRAAVRLRAHLRSRERRRRTAGGRPRTPRRGPPDGRRDDRLRRPAPARRVRPAPGPAPLLRARSTPSTG